MITKLLRDGVCSVAALAMLGMATAAAVERLPPPHDTPILQISGDIEVTNADGRAEFDLAMLEEIGVSRLQTSTPWTQGRPVFEGVLLRDLLEEVGANGDTVVAIALNDYRVEIPMSDLRNYPVLLASRMDGQRLRVRDKGPLWIIYPQDEYSELRTKQIQSRWVWQIKELHIN